MFFVQCEFFSPLALKLLRYFFAPSFEKLVQSIKRFLKIWYMIMYFFLKYCRSDASLNQSNCLKMILVIVQRTCERLAQMRSSRPYRNFSLFSIDGALALFCLLSSLICTTQQSRPMQLSRVPNQSSLSLWTFYFKNTASKPFLKFGGFWSKMAT